MKRFAFFALIAIATAAPLAAQNTAFGTGFWADIAPILSFSGQPVQTDSYVPTIDDLSAYMARPAFLSGGFSLSAGPFGAAMIVELQQDMGEMLRGGELTNLPLSRDYSTFMFSNNYPNVGFVEGSGDWWRLSLGRRAINIGRGVGSLSVSGGNPRYDHILAGLSAPFGKGSLDYDFLAISVARTSGAADDAKSLFFHRVGIDFPTLSFGFAEYNLVTGVDLDLQDFAPFLIYHHLFADGSNVMFHLDGEWRPVSPLRVYAEVLMDDFQLGAEGTGSNPNAFGFSAGAQWQILDGAVIVRPRYFHEDYSLAVDGKALEGGLVATLDAYWASTYLYRRNEANPGQAYSTRYFMQTNSSWNTIPSWFSYPLGPDRILVRGNLNYTLPGLSLAGEVSVAFLGSQSGETTYTSSHAENWLGPQTPITMGYDVSLGAEIVLGHNSLGTVKAGFSKRGADAAILSLTLGYTRRFATGATP